MIRLLTIIYLYSKFIYFCTLWESSTFSTHLSRFRYWQYLSARTLAASQHSEYSPPVSPPYVSNSLFKALCCTLTHYCFHPLSVLHSMWHTNASLLRSLKMINQYGQDALISWKRINQYGLLRMIPLPPGFYCQRQTCSENQTCS